MNSAMAKIFGKSTSFTADAEMQTKDKNGKKAISGVGMTMSYADGKIRSELDIAKMGGANMSADQVAQMKQMGMDKMVSIVRPDLKKMFIIYPNMKSYVEMPTPAEVTDTEQQPKIEKVELGKETVDGHPCVKNKLIITEADTKKKHEVTTWNATDLKDFPVKFETNEDGTTGTVLFKNVKFDKPAASQFEAPKDFEKFANMQQMMMKKMMGQ